MRMCIRHEGWLHFAEVLHGRLGCPTKAYVLGTSVCLHLLEAFVLAMFQRFGGVLPQLGVCLGSRDKERLFIQGKPSLC